MHIDWAVFGEVFVVSFGVAVGIIVVFAIGIGLLSAPSPTAEGPHLALAATDGATTTRTTATQARPTIARHVTAWICFLACALSVAYGLYIIIAK
jgi:hypothetical protein